MSSSIKSTFHFGETLSQEPFNFSYERLYPEHSFEMIKNFRSQLEEIATATESSWDYFTKVTIKTHENGEISVITRFDFFQILATYLLPFINFRGQKENQQTIEWLYDHFGYKRIQNICGRWKIDIRHNHAHGFPLTKRNIQRIFSGIADVRIDDMKLILRDIKSGEIPFYLHLSKAEYQTLNERFKEKTIDNMTKEECDILYDLLTPLNHVDMIYLNHPPKEIPLYKNRGFTLKGWNRVVYKIFNQRRNPKEKKWQYHYELLKRDLDYYTRKGAVIPMKDAYRFYYKKTAGGGAYAMLMKSMNKAEGKLNQIYYLPTQFISYTPKWWESVFEDFRDLIGETGAKQTYFDLREYLIHPESGFIDHKDEKVEFLGFSLGETQASRAFMLFLERAERFEGYCGPGVEEDLTKHYAKISEKNETKRKLRFTYEGPSVEGKVQGWDCTPFTGFGKIGLNATSDFNDVKVRVLYPGVPIEESTIEFPNMPTAPKGLWRTVRVFLGGLFSSHIRNILEEPYTEVSVRNSDEEGADLVNEVLDNSSKGWEDHRFLLLHRDESFVTFIKRMKGVTNSFRL